MKAKRRRRRRRGSHPARRRRVMTQTMMIQMRVKRKRSPRRFHERRNRPKDLISLRRRVRRGNNRRELHHLHQLHNHRQGSQICLINQLKLLHLLHRILVWDCLTTQLQCHRSHNLLPLRICLTMCNSLVNQHSHNSSQLVSASLELLHSLLLNQHHSQTCLVLSHLLHSSSQVEWTCSVERPWLKLQHRHPLQLLVQEVSVYSTFQLALHHQWHSHSHSLSNSLTTLWKPLPLQLQNQRSQRRVMHGVRVRDFSI